MAKKVLLFVLAALIFLLVFVVATTWIEHKIPLTLPVLPGSYPVGRVIYHWIDTSRIDSTAPEPNTRRELMVWIWYPAAKNSGGSKPAPYLPASLQKQLRQLQGFVMGDLLTSDPSKVRTHSLESPMLRTTTQRYPVVLMLSGLGAFAADYTTYAESLAAAGYIVVGSDKPYSTSVVVFPDGRVVKRSAAGHPSEAGPLSNFDRLAGFWSRDASFILDRLQALDKGDTSRRFTGRIDLDHVGIFGHSFGGATAAQFCVDDARCKAAVDLDGQPFGSVVTLGTNKPLLILTGDHHREPDSVTAPIRSRIEGIVHSSPTDHYWYQVRGAYHFNFSDMALTKEKWFARVVGATGPIGNARGLEVTAGCLRTFFDVYLRGASKNKVDSLRTQYPELELPGRDVFRQN